MAGPPSWLVYILRCADGSLYTGATNDLTARLARHQRGRGARYTRSRLPVRLVYSEATADRGAALRRELALKRLTRAAKLLLLATFARRGAAGRRRPSAGRARSAPGKKRGPAAPPADEPGGRPGKPPRRPAAAALRGTSAAGASRPAKGSRPARRAASGPGRAPPRGSARAPRR